MGSEKIVENFSCVSDKSLPIHLLSLRNQVTKILRLTCLYEQFDILQDLLLTQGNKPFEFDILLLKTLPTHLKYPVELVNVRLPREERFGGEKLGKYTSYWPHVNSRAVFLEQNGGLTHWPLGNLNEILGTKFSK